MRSFFPVLILLNQFLSPFTFQADVFDRIAQLLNSSNTKELARQFAPTVELSILDNEDSYSSAQAQQILRDFLLKNPPVQTRVVHLINTNPNHQFGVLSLQTKKGKFRVAVTLKKTGNTFFITELRMEGEK